jgi:probable rRNA maturation factor
MRKSKPNSPEGKFHVSIVRRSAGGALSGKKIREAVGHVLGRHGVWACDLEVVILGTARMRRLNEEWLGHEGPTDVVTFDLGQEGAARRTGTAVGQVNVCWPIAQRQGRLRGGRPEVELLLYVVHGVLHLLGYDDRREAAARRMHRKEDEILEELGYGKVYGGDGSTES